uniref:uncharacterized protein LOC101298112 n=1 Tax=Fragaria vesca subsp. vesca TaxID=101020 RepID=UPI0005C801A1|nr:PREDICTED: uncharacterized protein LOC101298112 [Fragaria vesca subsp. vesca]
MMMRLVTALVMFVLAGDFAAAGSPGEHHDTVPSLLKYCILLITVIRIFREIQHLRDVFDDGILIPRTAQDELTGNKSFEKHFLSTLSAFMWMYHAFFSVHNLLMILGECHDGAWSYDCNGFGQCYWRLSAVTSFAGPFESGVDTVVGLLGCLTSIALHYWAIKRMINIVRGRVPVKSISKKDSAIMLVSFVFWILDGFLGGDGYILLANIVGACVAVAELVLANKMSDLVKKP